MSEEFINKLREIYNKIMYFPNKVLEIFNDYYGEDRVDLQGFTTFDNIISGIQDYYPINYIVPTKLNLDSPSTFSYLSKSEKSRLFELLTPASYNCPIGSQEEIAMLLIPELRDLIRRVISKNGFILVHFPKVRVTNEHNKYVDITHLWAKVQINIDGNSLGYFSLNRSEYPISHIVSDYMHSHICGINMTDSTQFKSPCLGRGPIRNTLSTLASGFDENIWQLFCLELDRYVRVESLSGGPYRRLEEIRNEKYAIDRTLIDFPKEFGHYHIEYDDANHFFTKENMKDFLVFLISSDVLKFNFNGENYGIAIPFVKYNVLVSNLFIEWYNTRFKEGKVGFSLNGLLVKNILKKAIVKGTKIEYLRYSNNSNNGIRGEGDLICTFKGEPVYRHIIIENENSENTSILLNYNIVCNITRAILETLNFKYGRENNSEEAGFSSQVHYI